MGQAASSKSEKSQVLPKAWSSRTCETVDRRSCNGIERVCRESVDRFTLQPHGPVDVEKHAMIFVKARSFPKPAVRNGTTWMCHTGCGEEFVQRARSLFNRSLGSHALGFTFARFDVLRRWRKGNREPRGRDLHPRRSCALASFPCVR